MLSKIKIEVDFDHNNEPIIEILYRQSDDVRDKLIRSFIDKLGQVSSWCEIHCANAIQETDVNYAVQRWVIKPIEPKHLEERAFIINEQVRLINITTPHKSFREEIVSLRNDAHINCLDAEKNAYNNVLNKIDK